MSEFKQIQQRYQGAENNDRTKNGNAKIITDIWREGSARVE
jgi:hypothetical protein